MNLLRRFSLVCAVALVVLAVALGFLITGIYEKTAVDRVKRYLSQLVRTEARQNISEEDFSGPKRGEEYEAIRNKLSDILENQDIILTVVFSRDGTIVWSNYPDIVGDRLAGDPQLDGALRGRVEAQIVRPEEEDHDFPVYADEVMELYVPVTFGDPPRVAGAIEVYQNFDPLRASIRKTKGLTWLALSAGFGVLYLLLFGIVREGNRLIREGQDELRRSREKIESQRLDLLDRIGAAALHDPDIDAILREGVRDVRNLLDLSRCAIRLFGNPDTVIEDCAADFPSAASVFPASPRPEDSREIFERGERIVVRDVRSSPFFHDRREDLERIRLGSYIASPLNIEEEVLGVLFLDRVEPHAWTDDEIRTAEAVSRRMAVAVRHARMFQEHKDTAGRLTSLMDNVPGIVYRGLPDWTMPFGGADIERIAGYPAKAFTETGLKWTEIILPEDLEWVRRRVRDAVRSGEKVLRMEYRLVHRDGSIRWVADRRQLVYDERGRLAHIDGLVLDITERKKNEEAFRLTQFSVDRAGDAAYWMGPDGRLLYVNEKACRTLGYSREELLSMRIQEINPDFPPGSWDAHWEDVRRRKSFTMETRHRTRDGRTIPVEVTVNFIEFDGKEYNCASARDITERLRTQEEREQLQSQLLQAQKMEALGILAGGIAHDFNNLLTAILGYADLLGQGALPAEEAETAAGVIRNAAERASQLTAQLLGFARKGKNLAIPVDLHKVIDEVALLLDRTLDKRIRITRSFDSPRAMVLGDPTQLSQAVMNLAVNAGEAMPEGGSLILSTGTAVLDEEYCRSHPGASEGRYLLVSVRDTGVGIPEECIGKVFDPFFTSKEYGKGSGLGLSMVFGIVKNHGGYITVESEVGTGTVFSVYLPLAEGDLSLADPAPRGMPAAGARTGRVLLVDDQEAVRDVCSSMMKILGYEVITASDGREGVEVYRRLWKEIDLVIIDMVMPNLGGRDCFRKIKEVNPRVRAILSTGYSLEGAVQSIMDEGMAGFIQKPYRLEHLSRTVAEAMGRTAG